MMKSLFLCVMMVRVAYCFEPWELEWVNLFKDSFEFTCPNGAFINFIHSESSYGHRQFAMACSPSYVTSPTCEWHNNLNSYDAIFTFNCPDGKYLSGIASDYSNKDKDSVFKAQCCTMGDISPLHCEWTDYLNDYIGQLTYQPGCRYITTGFGSEHDNQHNDRRFKFQKCRLY